MDVHHIYHHHNHHHGTDEFMLSSILSNNRDVVSLVPVQQMTYSYLFDLTKQMITNVTNAGYTVISIISDNNVVNRKMFMSLSGSDHLMPYIMIRLEKGS